MEDRITKAINILKEHGISVSNQRVKILEYLIGNKDHPTADNIYNDLKKQVPVISKATVYNTLNLLVDKGILSKMTADKFETRYDTVVEPHGHFVCSKCNRIFNFPYQYSNEYEDLEGFKVYTAEIVLKGICKECKKEEKND